MLKFYQGDFDEIIKYYEERAKGGCGLIITEITRIDNETGIGMPNQLCAMEAKHVPRLNRLARAVHKHDTKIFLQLHHPGRQNRSRVIEGRQIAAPSPITCKTIGEKPREMTTEEVEGLVKKFVIGAKIAKTAEIVGVDAINVSSGTYESGVTIIEPISYPEGWKRHLAQGIKDNVQIPVIACNAIKTPQFAEKLLAENNCDFIALGRAQLADPEFGKKAMEGKEKDIRPCIGCLNCIESVANGVSVRCAVNPKLGYEIEYEDYKKIDEEKTVAVLGGGPAGMEAARVLATRGFKVVLFEKRERLGGSVYLGTIPPHKQLLQSFIDNMEYQIRELGVDIRLNTAPTIEELKELDPYAVFVAIGGKNIAPPMIEVDGEKVLFATDVLERELDVENKKIVVVGSGMTGLETAEYLAAKGNSVTGE